ncbi:MAG: mechanosensitive ion channel [Gammaproteobacteria bacterium]|nr:mechanosensitive ion channel [Gammaproteobacteria bacterium]MDH5727676.1 mechanosensitive ion channel [Gammaproteobacteria bacterium]
MSGLWNDFINYLSSDQFWSILRALVLLIIGFFIAKIISTTISRSSKKWDAHRSMLIRRGINYLIIVLFGISALKELGFNLNVLLGAAGILSVAIGFASQTSMSNLISGLFLVTERPFSAGDIIRVGTTTGEVLSIDPLSVKLRTFDNLFVRIPNEVLIKSEVTTLTRFPIRRIDIQLGVSYQEDLKKVRQSLEQVAAHNPLCLEEPKPQYMFQNFADSSMNIQFSVWTKRENFLDLKNNIYQEIKAEFDAQNIRIPFPQRTVHIDEASINALKQNQSS